MRLLSIFLALVLPAAAQHQADGLKVGEVTPTSAVVWTRATRSPVRNATGRPVPRDLRDLPAGTAIDGLVDAVPGAPAQVRLVYGPQGEAVLSTGWVTVDPTRDFTHQFLLEGLRPGGEYRLTSELRAIGSDRTSSSLSALFKTPALAATPQRVVFTVVTGQDFQRRDDPASGHRIYGPMADLEPSFFVHTGDVVYYDKTGPLAKDLATARYKWNRMYALPLQRRFHALSACYFIEDDHDVLKNDCWPGQTYGQLTWEQGLRLFDEQTPAPERPYRRVRWGQDLEVWLLEGREFRSANNAPDGPGKSILGQEQRRWLERTLSASDASLRVVISATPIVGPDRKNKNDNHANEGFHTEGQWLRALLASQHNTFVICGDRHWQYVSEDPLTGLIEFSCGPTSDAHAGGFSKDPQDMHRYLRVKGGFLSVTVAREWGVPVATFRHHDVAGEVLNEVRVR